MPDPFDAPLRWLLALAAIVALVVGGVEVVRYIIQAFNQVP